MWPIFHWSRFWTNLFLLDTLLTTCVMPFSAATSETNATTSRKVKGGSPIAPLVAWAAKSLAKDSLSTLTCSFDELAEL